MEDKRVPAAAPAHRTHTHSAQPIPSHGGRQSQQPLLQCPLVTSTHTHTTPCMTWPLCPPSPPACTPDPLPTHRALLTGCSQSWLAVHTCAYILVPWTPTLVAPKLCSQFASRCGPPTYTTSFSQSGSQQIRAPARQPSWNKPSHPLSYLHQST